MELEHGVGSKPRSERYVMFVDGAGPDRLEDCWSWRGLRFRKTRLSNRVSTKGGEAPKAEYIMKMTHVALDAV
ncbi:hypothetical protein THIOKS12070018 [Thiocapsa sp. KS1]|nr:hypothetical protein [Thiocapsa sp. KS1]CRI64662.1 hypothetical protein THIOKS12070018 [Thiocapsa sp. KS1]